MTFQIAPSDETRIITENVLNMYYSLAIFLTSISIVMSCPPQQELHPCTCEMVSDSAHITCSHLDNDQTLVTAAGSIKSKRYIYSFYIEHSQFYFIPHDTFNGAQFVELELKETSLMALTDTDVAFEGLEDHLEILMMTDCTFMNDWDWAIFRNLRKLRRLDIVHGDLESIGEDMEKINISSVNDINFYHNRISYVHPFAFSNFKELMILYLDHNEIREMTRSMLPDPAAHLLHLDISYNQIEEFAEDMFTHMPLLRMLNVGYNKILVLNENTFSPVWELVESFSALGNELRCDCRLSWILTKRHPESLRATCAMPKEVRGRGLGSLTSKDLWCYRK